MELCLFCVKPHYNGIWSLYFKWANLIFQDKAVVFLTEKMLNGEDPNQQCTVMEQKELPDGLRDEACGRAVLANHAGLCLWVNPLMSDGY